MHKLVFTAIRSFIILKAIHETILVDKLIGDVHHSEKGKCPCYDTWLQLSSIDRFICSGDKKFNIPFEVNDLAYGQTVGFRVNRSLLCC